MTRDKKVLQTRINLQALDSLILFESVTCSYLGSGGFFSCFFIAFTQKQYLKMNSNSGSSHISFTSVIPCISFIWYYY